MNIAEYQKKAYTAIQIHEDKKDAILNWAVGLSEESGEVLGLIKHQMWAGENPSKEEYAKEIGDVLWYLSALCTELDIDFETVASMNLYKLKRRYGDCFDASQSLERHEIEKKMSQDEEYKCLARHL